MSPQARAFFHAMCSQVGITLLELLLWIHTRWGSLFKFLNHFILLKAVCLTIIALFGLIGPPSQAINQFILLADASENVPNLTKQRSYTDYHLTHKDWEHLRDIRDALMVSSF